jgi:hypothetical protein
VTALSNNTPYIAGISIGDDERKSVMIASVRPHSERSSWVASSSFRRLTTSASCPAGSASRNSGMTWMPPSHPRLIGDFVCWYTCHARATDWICPPTIASTKLTANSRYSRVRSAAYGS